MTQDAALRSALSLVALPAQVKAQRSAPLPEGIALLLNIAAGDEDDLNRAAEATSRSIAEVRRACEFFIEQILLHPDSDSYRVLGATANAPPSQLRANMALLMRWLHPDIGRLEKRAALANRVLQAWEDLKTAERRQSYQHQLQKSAQSPPVKQHRIRQAPRPAAISVARQGLLQRLVLRFLRRTV